MANKSRDLTQDVLDAAMEMYKVRRGRGEVSAIRLTTAQFALDNACHQLYLQQAYDASR